jgi:uncharacterized repeat protein (TIGR01451 family)
MSKITRTSRLNGKMTRGGSAPSVLPGARAKKTFWMRMPTLLMLILFLFPVMAMAAVYGDIDQRNDDMNGNIVDNLIYSSKVHIGQEFVPAMASLVGVEVLLRSVNVQASAEITVTIHKPDSSGSIISGSTIAAGTKEVPYNNDGRSDWVYFNFDTPVEVIPGETYVLEVSSNNNCHAWRSRYTGDPYPAGRYIEWTIDSQTPDENGMDALFRTYCPPHPILYVDADNGTASTKDGYSWATAFTDLQQALAIANPGNQIWVAKGTYTPTLKYPDELTNTDPRTATFLIEDGVSIYGGFAGTETFLSQRDWINNVTTLSGDLNNDDVNFTNRGDNSYHVVTVQEEVTSSARLDGFTISGGHADLMGSDYDSGGGLINDGWGHPVLENLIFSSNYALLQGGGAYFDQVDDITLTNVIFRNNWVEGDPTDIFNSYAYGGAIVVYDGSYTFVNAVFSGNRAGPESSNPDYECLGGAVYTSGENSVTFINSTFNGNSSADATTCVSCEYGGGAIFSWGKPVSLVNCILWNNYPENLKADEGGEFTVIYSDVGGSGGSDSFTDGGNNINNDPSFVSEVDPAAAPTDLGDLRLLEDSLAIDVGDNSAVPPGVTRDPDGNVRIAGTRVDMGAYEYMVNTAPIITSADHALFKAGDDNVFTVESVGWPLPSLSIGGDSLPSSLTFTVNNNGTGVLSGNPTEMDTGVYEITFKAANDVSPDAVQNFTLRVVAEAAPAIISADNATFIVGEDDSFTITTSGFPLPSINLDTGDGDELPEGVTFTDNGDGTATISGIAEQCWGWEYDLVIQAQNTLGNVVQDFTLTVNEAPTFYSDNDYQLTLYEGAYSTAIVSMCSWPYPDYINLDTVNSDTLPAGVEFIYNASLGSGYFSGTPAIGTSDSYTVTLIASNGIGTPVSQPYTLTITQPTVPSFTSAAKTTFSAGTYGEFMVSAIGPPAPSITLTSGTLPSGLTFMPSYVMGRASLEGTPAPGTGGIYPLTFTASNGPSSTATQSFTLTVLDTFPIITAHPQSLMVNAGETAGFTVEAVSKSAITYQWEMSANGGKKWKLMEGATSNILNVLSTTSQMDGYQYRAVVSTAGGIRTSNTATLHVVAPPDPNPEKTDASISQAAPVYDSTAGLITWEITVENISSVTARQVVISDALFKGTKLYSFAANAEAAGFYTYKTAGSRITITIPLLAPGESMTFTLQAAVPARMSGIISNTADVMTENLDADMTNNSCTAEVEVVAAP